MTIWKPTEKFPGYEACDDGRIRSLTREVQTKGGGTRIHHGKVLSPFKPNRDWQYVSLSFDGGRSTVSVGRLIWETFHEPLTDQYDISHANGITDDNRLENLIRCPRDNRKVTGKLTEAQVVELRRLRAEEHWTYLKLGERFGIHHTTASRIVKHLTWKAVPRTKA